MRDQTGIFSFHCAHSYSLRQVFEAKGKQNAILLRCGKEKTIALLNEVVMDELLKNISIEDLEKLKVQISFLKTDDIKSSITIRFFKEEYLNYVKRNLSPAYYSSILLLLINLLILQTSKD